MIKNKIDVRSHGADSNLCEILRDNDCKGCSGCANESFIIKDYGDFFTISYTWKIGEAVIESYSERISKETLKQI